MVVRIRKFIKSVIALMILSSFVITQLFSLDHFVYLFSIPFQNNPSNLKQMIVVTNYPIL